MDILGNLTVQAQVLIKIGQRANITTIQKENIQEEENNDRPIKK